MSFRDCLQSAVDQGVITATEARDLGDRFDEMHAQARLELGDEGAASVAKDRLAKQLRIESARDKRIVALTEQARRQIKSAITGYRDSKGDADILEGVLGLFEHFGFHGYSSIEGRFKSIVGLAHADMEAMLHDFDRTWATGQRKNQARLTNVVRELHGEATGDQAAKALADSFETVSEKLRQRFNAAGGDVARLERWGGPQYHDPAAVLRAGRQSWKDAIRPRLDPDRMRDPLTGQAPTPGRLEQLLDGAYDSIVSNGDVRLKPAGRPNGLGALANQRAEHRFFAFKSADDWLAYADSFGQGDPFVAWMNHIKGMARDIAAMEILGPNPSATVEWLKQVVEQQQGWFVAGKPSYFHGGTAAKVQAKAGVPAYRIDTVWQEVRGDEPVSGRMAAGFAAVRNLITSAVLGSASLTAIATDPFIGTLAKKLSGLPTSNYFTEVVKSIGYNSREAVRAGLILEDALHQMGQESRYAGSLAGPVWSRYVSDRVMTWQGLAGWTRARKHIFGMEFQAYVADQVGADWAALPERLRRTMAGYGLQAADWDAMRAAPLYEPETGASFLRPVDVRAGGEGASRAAEKYLEMILSETERAVPSGTKRSQAILSAGTRPGTVAGEGLRSALMFKSFALSFTTLQLEAISREIADFGKARGAGYVGQMLIALTLGGAMGLTLKAIANGKDTPDPTDWRNWAHALQTGGGFGIYGDFLFADVNRFGYSLGEQLAGPVVGLGTDIAELAGNAKKWVTGEKTSVGPDAIRFAQRYMPTASLWYLRAAYQRVVFDQLQYLASPDAHRAMRERERRLRSETGQEFWWRPGEVMPSRPPGFTSP